MDPELRQKLEEQGVKLDAIYKSVEKTRRYFQIVTWVTIIAIVLPLLGLVFAIPAFMNNYVGALGGI